MVAYYSVQAVSFLLFTYLLKLFRKPYHTIAENSVGVVDALMSKLEEDQKVELVQKRMNALLMGLLLGTVVLVIAVVIGALPLCVYGYTQEIGFDHMTFSSGYAILAISLGSTIGFMLPVPRKYRSSYSELAQLLHRMVLNNYSIGAKLFNRALRAKQKEGLKPNDKFLIVSGLARAGTTSIMNYLASDNSFACLSYSNMPFLAAPNLWAKLYKPKSGKKKERSHGDGIKIGLDSNEALEEYFIKMITLDRYIGDEVITLSNLSQEEYEAYLNYQSLVKQSNKELYLAKNNNFILHYEGMRSYNDAFVMVLMFREPLAQASSLLEKHLHYTNMQQEDPFVLEYMNWLGHHEFGINQKAFSFQGHTKEYEHQKSTLDYWLGIWINYYEQALKLNKKNVVFMNYDAYCNNPKQQLHRVYNSLGLDFEPTNAISPFVNKRKEAARVSKELETRADEIYKQLLGLV